MLILTDENDDEEEEEEEEDNDSDDADAKRRSNSMRVFVFLRGGQLHCTTKKSSLGFVSLFFFQVLLGRKRHFISLNTLTRERE